MPNLYPNQPFTEGDVFSPDLAYLAMTAPYFDDQPQYLGHRVRIQDSELDNGAGSIKSRFGTIESSLKVSLVSGLTVSVSSGLIRIPDGTQAVIAATNITVPDNAVSFVYISADGYVRSALTTPVLRTILAKVTASAGTISTIEDWRSISVKHVQAPANAIKVFGGVSQTDRVATQSEVYGNGLYYFRDFTVPAGISITVDRWVRIFCSGNVNIAGTINVTPMATGASPFAAGAATTTGGSPGSGVGAGGGSSGWGGYAYPYGAQPYGSGGGLGFTVGNAGSAIVFGAGGRGGGGIWLEAAGTITISGQISADGEGAYTGSIISGSANVSGSGGGSGGLIYLSSLVSITANATAVLSVKGGNGGAPASTLTNAGVVQGGAGGAGGWIVCNAPNVNLTGATARIDGAAKGTDINTGGTGGLGGGGGGGFGGQGGQQSVGSVGKLQVNYFVPVGG